MILLNGIFRHCLDKIVNVYLEEISIHFRTHEYIPIEPTPSAVDRKFHNIFHASLLRLYKQNVSDSKENPPLLKLGASQQSEYESEKRLSTKIQIAKEEYLVK